MFNTEKLKNDDLVTRSIVTKAEKGTQEVEEPCDVNACNGRCSTTAHVVIKMVDC